MKFSKITWGLVFLLAAGFLIINQIYGFAEIGIGSLIISLIAAAIIINCIISFNFTYIFIPLAVLYIIYWEPLGLPEIPTWTLILAALLTTAGLSIIFPVKNWHRFNKKFNNSGEYTKHIPGETEDSCESNQHKVSINFGALSRRLHSASLESVQLDCKFGALEIFLDQAVLSPNGAEVCINCNFGAVELNIPKEWRIIEKMNCTLGGIDAHNNSFSKDENAPALTITGNVAFGGVEIKST